MKKLVFIFLCVAPVLNGRAQEEDETIDAIIDEILLEDGSVLEDLVNGIYQYHLFYTSLDVESATYFAGRKSRIKQFNVQPQMTYAHGNGLFAAVGAKYYSELDPNWDVISVNLGYAVSLDRQKQWNTQLGYTRYNYSGDLPSLFKNSIDGGLSYVTKKRTLGSQVMASYLFGDDEAWQFNWRTFFSQPIYGTDRYTLSFRPSVNLLVAKQTLELSRYRIRNGQLIQQFKSIKIFDLLNTQVKLPIQITTQNFELALHYTINLPNAIGLEKKLDPTGFFGFNLGYVFFL